MCRENGLSPVEKSSEKATASKLPLASLKTIVEKIILTSIRLVASGRKKQCSPRSEGENACLEIEERYGLGSRRGSEKPKA